MSIIWLEQGVTWNSAPPFARNIGYEVITREADSVTFKVHFDIKINRDTSSAFYGYPIYWEINDGTDYKMKGTEKWYGGQAYRRFNITYKVKVGAGAGTTNCKIRCWATSGGTMSFTKNYTLNYPAWNAPPVFKPGAKLRVRLNDANGLLIAEDPWIEEDSFKIPESETQFYLEWDEATDADNNFDRYEVWHQANNGAWSKISTQKTSRNFTHKVTGGPTTQGYSYDYYVKAIDTLGESAKLDTTQFRKNILTPAVITNSTLIDFDTTEVNIEFKSASNEVANQEFSYSLESDVIVIHNKQHFTGVLNVLESKISEDTPYILRSDLYKFLESSGYKGSLPIKLISTNIYGSENSTSYNLTVDLQTPPNPPTKITISEKASTKLGSFIIPNRQRTRITYEGATDPLGSSLVYSVSYSLDGGKSFQSIANETPNTSLLMELPTVKEATPVTFRVITKSNITGKTVTKDLTGEIIHFYNQPSITLTNPVRTSNAFTVDVKTIINTSIPGAKLGTQTFTGFDGTSKPFTGGLVTIVDENIPEEASYNLYVASNDNTGLSNVVTSIWVNPAKPVFSIRESGVGVNCVNDGSEADFKVEGSTLITEDLKVEKNLEVMGGLTITENLTISKNLSVVDIDSKSIKAKTINGDNAYIFNANTTNLKANTLTHNGGGSIFINSATYIHDNAYVKKGNYTTTFNSRSVAFNNKNAIGFDDYNGTDYILINYQNGFKNGVKIWGLLQAFSEDIMVLNETDEDTVRNIKTNSLSEVLGELDECTGELFLDQAKYNAYLYRGLQLALLKIEELESR